MMRSGLALDAEVRKHGARTILFMTWAGRDRPEMLERVVEAYEELARESDAIVAPVGLAWGNARDALPTLDLYAQEGIHPTPAGSYLTACVFFSTIFGASPEGLGRRIVLGDEVLVDLSPELAGELQSITWSTVRDYSDPGKL
jgi:hypothetical protein